MLLGGPSPPSQLVPNPFNWFPNTVVYRYLGIGPSNKKNDIFKGDRGKRKGKEEEEVEKEIPPWRGQSYPPQIPGKHFKG